MNNIRFKAKELHTASCNIALYLKECVEYEAKSKKAQTGLLASLHYSWSRLVVYAGNDVVRLQTYIPRAGHMPALMTQQIMLEGSDAKEDGTYFISHQDMRRLASSTVHDWEIEIDFRDIYRIDKFVVHTSQSDGWSLVAEKFTIEDLSEMPDYDRFKGTPSLVNSVDNFFRRADFMRAIAIPAEVAMKNARGTQYSMECEAVQLHVDKDWPGDPHCRMQAHDGLCAANTRCNIRGAGAENMKVAIPKLVATLMPKLVADGPNVKVRVKDHYTVTVFVGFDITLQYRQYPYCIRQSLVQTELPHTKRQMLIANPMPLLDVAKLQTKQKSAYTDVAVVLNRECIIVFNTEVYDHRTGNRKVFRTDMRDGIFQVLPPTEKFKAFADQQVPVEAHNFILSGKALKSIRDGLVVMMKNKLLFSTTTIMTLHIDDIASSEAVYKVSFEFIGFEVPYTTVLKHDPMVSVGTVMRKDVE